MNNDQTRELAEMIDMMQRVELDAVVVRGGYPAEVAMVLEPSVVIAGDREGEGEPELTVIPLQIALEKFRKAKNLVQNIGMEWSEAFGEVSLW